MISDEVSMNRDTSPNAMTVRGTARIPASAVGSAVRSTGTLIRIEFRQTALMVYTAGHR